MNRWRVTAYDANGNWQDMCYVEAADRLRARELGGDILGAHFRPEMTKIVVDRPDRMVQQY